jgi:hypothetical protein
VKAADLPMTEDELLAAVLGMAKVLHVRTAHFRPARTEKGWRTSVSGDGKGFLDVTLLGTRLLVRELKTEVGVLTPDQRLWIAAWEVARVDVDVWRPSDLRSGRIEAELRAISPKTPAAMAGSPPRPGGR